MLKKQNFFKGSLILIVSAALAKVLGALFKIPLTNLLGGVGMGYFGCAYGLFLPLYAVSATGLSAAVAKLTAEEAAKGRFSGVRRIRRVSRIMFSGAGALLTIIIILAARPFAVYTTGTAEPWYAVLMIAPSALFGCMSAVERGYYEGLQNMYPTAVSQAVEAAAKLAFGLFLADYVLTHPDEVLVFFPDGTDVISAAAAAAVLGVTLSSAAGLLYFALRNLSGDIKSAGTEKAEKPESSRKTAKRLLLTMLPITLGSLGAALASVTDLCTVMRCIGSVQENYPQELAEKFGAAALERDFPAFVYGAFTGMAVTVFNLVPSVTNMFAKSVLPCAARAYARGKKNSLRQQVRSVMLAAGIISFPSGAGLALLAEPVMAVLYGGHPEESAIASQALVSLCPAMVCLCLVTPLFSIMQGMGRAYAPVKIMLAGAAVKLAGNLILIPHPESAVTGAGISTSICYTIMLVLAVATLRRELGGELHIIKTMLPVLYASLMCGGAVYVTEPLFSRFGSIAELLGCTAAGGAVFIAVMLLTGHSIQNLRDIRI